MDLNSWQKRIREDKKRATDHRTEYERDEARIIHSAAFRRLQSKTQIFSMGESDIYRTRLTHSMEVAQIGRGIINFLQHKKQYNELLPSPSLITSICLAHDIGHPPFGHGGEYALNYCMKNSGGFEGNAQTLRILSKLEKYTPHNGLNPTRRTLLGTLKYPISYSKAVNEAIYKEQNTPNPKWLFKKENAIPPKCYFDSEQSVVDFILDDVTSDDKERFLKISHKPNDKNPHFSSCFKSLDCSIMDISDEIAYSLHDLEDAISLGLIRKDDWISFFSLSTYEAEFKTLLESAFYTYNLSFDDITHELFHDRSYKRKKATGTIIHFLISQIEFCENTSGCEDPLLRLNIQLPKLVNALKDHLSEMIFKKVICSLNVQQVEFKGQKLILELFDLLKNEPLRFLPEKTQNKILPNMDNEQQKDRIIADFISGMTDNYAIRYYEKIFFPTKGSMFDKF
ncbi:anti-phage deoxyguanosine triphosphatase [Paraphotobacterium marinum]|uniref:anti-phage deoxyguanosine triphosphatase n=1 Tax=Paraphotobacterium marinum TaxID=1755811 RepID=UPI0039E78555